MPVSVKVNVYDLISANGYLYSLGLGAYHSGVEISGVEYAFGGHDEDRTGVFEMVPRSDLSNATFRETLDFGHSNLSEKEIRAVIDRLRQKYHGKHYHIIHRNCNHFSDELLTELCGRPLPTWINRMAWWGSFAPAALLPAAPSEPAEGFQSFSGAGQGLEGDNPRQPATAEERRKVLAEAALRRIEPELTAAEFLRSPT